mmetsp:Transcript_3556/g.8975  ORF Transcript_3556/g.8975 Transcript_3556/m.8975 type:complete len:521 (-) Transcript_3556:448-2010(-)
MAGSTPAQPAHPWAVESEKSTAKLNLDGEKTDLDQVGNAFQTTSLSDFLSGQTWKQNGEDSFSAELWVQDVPDGHILQLRDLVPRTRKEVLARARASSVCEESSIVQKLQELQSKDHIFHTRIDKKQFVLSLIIETLGPLGIPLCYSLEGMNAVRNRGLLPGGVGGLWKLGVDYLFWGFILAAYIFQSGCLTRTECAWALCTWCLRNLVIALKYGYAPPEMVERMMREVVPCHELHQIELIAGWLELSASLVDSEIAVAYRTLQLDLRNVRIQNIDPLNTHAVPWMKSAEGLHAHAVLRGIIVGADDTVRKVFFLAWTERLAFGLALILGVLPCSLRVYHCGWRYILGKDERDVPLIVASSFFTTWFGYINFRYLITAVVHYARIAFTSELLTRLFSRRHHHEPPPLPLCAPGNTSAYLQVHEVARLFGLRYKKRVDATVGGFIVLNAGVTCIMVAGLLDCTASLLFILQCGFSFLILTALIGGVLLLVGRSAHQLRFADALALVLEEYAVAKVAAQDSV